MGPVLGQEQKVARPQRIRPFLVAQPWRLVVLPPPLAVLRRLVVPAELGADGGKMSPNPRSRAGWKPARFRGVAEMEQRLLEVALPVVRPSQHIFQISDVVKPQLFFGQRGRDLDRTVMHMHTRIALDEHQRLEVLGIRHLPTAREPRPGRPRRRIALPRAGRRLARSDRHKERWHQTRRPANREQQRPRQRDGETDGKHGALMSLRVKTR